MSELNFKDYVGYYIGCKVRHEFVTKTKNIELRDGTLTGIDTDGIVPCCWVRFNYNDRVRLDSIKPILRKLEDITEEECEEYNKIHLTMYSINKAQDQMKSNAASTNYLIKQGFDLFDLIHHNAAIDSNTLK